MGPHVISTYQDLRPLLGQDLGFGNWSQIGAEQAQRFASACGREPVNPSEGAPASAALHPAFVSGALLLSLLGRLRSTMENVRFAYASTMSIFYGFDNVRFFEPVPAPVTIRLHLRIVDAKMLDRSTLHVVYGHRLETRQGATALTADAINRIHLRAGFIEKTDVH